MHITPNSYGYPIGFHAMPFVDKIAITIPQPNTVMPNSILNGGATDFSALSTTAAWIAVNDKGLLQSAKKSRYFKIAVMINLKSTDAQVFLEIVPKDPTKTPFARLEYNPARLGIDGLEELWSIMTSFFEDGWEYVYNYSKVSKLDVTIDIHDVEVEQVHFLNKWPTKQTIYETNGHAETIYLGMSTSQQTKIYNKLAHLNMLWPVPVTRIERRLTPQIMLKDLHLLKNPFGHLTVAHKQPTKPKGAHLGHWIMFNDSVVQRGSAAALKLLDAKTRKKYLSHTQKSAPDWWDPEVFWQHWPAAVQPIQHGGALAPQLDKAA